MNASRLCLRLDGGFLVAAGSVAAAAEIAGHFFGVGPFRGQLGSPYTVGGFEAHALAVIVGAVLWLGAGERNRGAHALGLPVHVVLGSANLIFWPTFAALNAVHVGVITTTLHWSFVLAHGLCLSRGGVALSPARPSTVARPLVVDNKGE